MVSLRVAVTLLFTLFTAFGHSEISTRLSSNSIEELESVRLLIRAHNTRESEALDLTGLQDQFHIMGNNTSTQYQYINGRTQSWVDYQITLQPKTVGALTIPPIRIGNLSTKAMTLDVRPLAPSARQQIDELVFYQQQFSSTKAYVQSQILMQRQLFYAGGVQLYGGQPGAPNIENASVITLGENQATTIQRNGRSYGVVTQNYAIFPEASGPLTVPAVEITASVRMLNNGRVSRKGVRVATEAAAINVMPIPDSYPKNSPWLPATNVSITQTLEPAVTEIPFNVGDTLTQAIKITVESNNSSIVPPLTSALPANIFREYPEPAKLTNSTQGTKVVGQRMERRSIVPLTSGTLTLPSAEVVWWDTEVNKVKRTTLAPLSFSTNGDSINPAATAGRETAQVRNPPPVADNDPTNAQAATNAIDAGNPIAGSQRVNWALVAGICALGLLVAFKLLSNTLTNRRWALKRARKSLLHRIRTADALGVQHSLREYLQLRYALPPSRALSAWISEEPEAKNLVRLLEAWCYSEKPSIDVPRQALQLAEDLLMHNVSVHNRVKNGVSLPALYPSS